MVPHYPYSVTRPVRPRSALPNHLRTLGPQVSSGRGTPAKIEFYGDWSEGRTTTYVEQCMEALSESGRPCTAKPPSPAGFSGGRQAWRRLNVLRRFCLNTGRSGPSAWVYGGLGRTL